MRIVVNTLLERLGILTDSIRILNKIPLECLGIHMNSLGMPIIVNSLWNALRFLYEFPYNAYCNECPFGMPLNSIGSSAKSLWNAVRFL